MELFHGLHVTAIFLPVVLLAVLGEAFFYTRRNARYPWRDSLVSFPILIGHSLSGGISYVVITTGLAAAVWHARLATIDLGRWWNVVVLFFLVEFAYYWYHRAAHRVRLLWGSHSVHHSPAELTFSVAYRLNWTPLLSGSWLFFLPLVWIGFDPVWVFGMVSASLLYQFWLHTTLIPKLGPLEGIVNTPSAHRVHHASNDQYLDKNYGGTLMIFDRLFGTYVPEDDAVPLRFGLVHPLVSTNPLVIVFHEFHAILKDVWHARTWRDRLGYLFAPPGWVPSGRVIGAVAALALLPGLGGCVGLAVKGVSTAAQQTTIASNQSAAEAGDARAQYELGKSYCCKIGRVDALHDTVKATAWLCKAARQDYQPAQHLLGLIYAGKPVAGFDPQQSAKLLVVTPEVNNAVAAAWQGRAARDGDPDSVEAMAAVRAKLTEAERAVVQSYAADWRAAPSAWDAVFRS